MAKLRDNDLLDGLTGRLGRQLVIRRMRDGRTIVLTRPDFSSRIFSPGQESHQARFRQAAAYARSASKANPVYAQLAAGTPKNAYNLALSDWFHPPVIHSVRREGGRVLVHATDNVRVAQVLVKVMSDRGEPLEQGPAVLSGEDTWEYTPAHAGRLLVEARDLAGNRTQAECE